MSCEVLKYAAFTADGRGGNPAGVVLDADSLTEARMLAVAEAIGFSETAFVTDGGERLRFFSPRAEVAFCGHATVATAVALAERDGTGTRDLVTAAGPVRTETSEGPRGVVATLTSPPARSGPIEREVLDEVLAAFGWSRDELDLRYPARVAHAGNDHPVLGLTDLGTLARFDYDDEALAGLAEREGWTTVHAFVRVGPGEFRVRNAFPPGGVHEDPATGAAAAAFAGYLRDLGELEPDGRLTLHQGVEMGRPSLIEVAVTPGDPRVRVSGTATRLALSPYDEQERS